MDSLIKVKIETETLHDTCMRTQKFSLEAKQTTNNPGLGTTVIQEQKLQFIIKHHISANTAALPQIVF